MEVRVGGWERDGRGREGWKGVKRGVEGGGVERRENKKVCMCLCCREGGRSVGGRTSRRGGGGLRTWQWVGGVAHLDKMLTTDPGNRFLTPYRYPADHLSTPRDPVREMEKMTTPPPPLLSRFSKWKDWHVTKYVVFTMSATFSHSKCECHLENNFSDHVHERSHGD